MAYTILLTDIDNTLLDFIAGSHAALRETLEAHGIPFTQERLHQYLTINASLWEAYERGDIPKEAIYLTRFRRLFEALGVEADPASVNRRYMEGLRSNIFFMPHCMEFLDAVRGKVKLYAVTNGDTLTQEVRLKNSGIGAYFDGVFISEQMGCKKPEKAFFDQVFAAIGPVDQKSCLLLGDSLTSDMQGGPQRRGGHLPAGTRGIRPSVRLRRRGSAGGPAPAGLADGGRERGTA